MSNEIDECRILYSQKRYEEAIKSGLTILADKRVLTATDSSTIFTTLAYSFREIGAHTQALIYAKELAAINDRNGIGESSYLFLPGFFSSTGQLDSALLLYKDLEQQCLHDPEKEDYLLLKTWNNIGYLFFKKSELDSALIYYDKVLKHPLAKSTYSDIYGLAMGNKGQLFLFSHDYAKALPYLRIDANLTKGKIWQSYNSALYGIALSEFNLGQISEAETTMKTLLSQKNKLNDQLLKYYLLMSEIQSKKGREDLSKQFLIKYIELSDSLKKTDIPTQHLVDQITQSKIDMFEKELQLKDNQLQLIEIKEHESSLQNKIYILVIILIVILLLFTIVYFIGYQKRKRKIHELETNLLHSKLVNKKEDLNNLVKSLSFKHQFIEDFKSRLKVILRLPSDEANVELKNLHQDVASYSVIDKNLELLHADIEKVNTEFIMRLEKEFPSLTAKEKELCSMIVLNLNSKDIAILKNVSPEAVKKARHRLRKKLNIEIDQDIREFLIARNP